MLQSLQNITVFTDKDIPIIALDKKDNPVEFLVDLGNFYAKGETDVFTEFG